jgi:hypothetical protein
VDQVADERLGTVEFGTVKQTRAGVKRRSNSCCQLGVLVAATIRGSPDTDRWEDRTVRIWWVLVRLRVWRWLSGPLSLEPRTHANGPRWRSRLGGARDSVDGAHDVCGLCRRPDPQTPPLPGRSGEVCDAVCARKAATRRVGRDTNRFGAEAGVARVVGSIAPEASSVGEDEGTVITFEGQSHLRSGAEGGVAARTEVHALAAGERERRSPVVRRVLGGELGVEAVGVGAPDARDGAKEGSEYRQWVDGGVKQWPDLPKGVGPRVPLRDATDVAIDGGRPHNPRSRLSEIAPRESLWVARGTGRRAREAPVWAGPG